MTAFEHDPIAGYGKSAAEQRLKGVEEPQAIWVIVDFFETIGMLVRRGYLDAYDVWHKFAFWTVKDLQSLYDYDQWANKKLLTVIAQLPSEQFTQNVAGSYGSIRRESQRVLAAQQRVSGCGVDR